MQNYIKLKAKNQAGFMALVTILVITTVALILATSASILGIGELQMGFNNKQSIESLAVADACLDEALIRLRRDNSYSSGSLNVGDNSCTITVAPSGNLRTITVESDVNDVVKKIEAQVDVSAETRLLVMVGLLGSFTTYATFSNETMNLLQDEKFYLSLINILSHIVFGLLGVLLGRLVINLIWR